MLPSFRKTGSGIPKVYQVEPDIYGDNISLILFITQSKFKNGNPKIEILNLITLPSIILFRI
jgi:hypothetical protein